MPIFDFRVLQHKAIKNGSNAVRISIAHNGETRYLKSPVAIDSPNEFKNGIVVKRPDAVFLNTMLRKFMNRVQDITQSIEYVNGLTCSELVAIINHRLKAPQTSSSPTIVSVFNEYIESARISNRSIALFKECFKSIRSFFADDLTVDQVKYNTIMKYEKHLRNIGNSDSTIRTKMALLSKIIVYARRCEYVPAGFNPFSDYSAPEATVRDCWLTIDQMATLRDAPLKGAMENRTRDFIMLSYCLGGINIVDLLNINFKALRKSSKLRYIRKKTARQPKINKYVEFSIPPQAWVYIDKLMMDDGYLGTKYQRRSLLHDYFSQCIKSLRNQTGIDNLVYYSARKSFAQHAFMLGVPTSVIDYILGHKLNKSGKSLFNYIYVTPEMATDALKKVLDNLG